MSSPPDGPTDQSIEPERDRERPGTTTPFDDAQIAHAILAGHPAGSLLATTCDACGTSLPRGGRVTVTIDITPAGVSDPRLYCRTCPSTPRNERDEVNVAATAELAIINTLGQRRNRAALRDVTVTDCRPAEEGE